MFTLETKKLKTKKTSRRAIESEFGRQKTAFSFKNK